MVEDVQARDSTAPEPGRWRMFAHQFKDGLFYNLGSRRFVEYHGLPDPIFEVEVVEIAPDDETGRYWGWIEMGESEPLFSAPHRGMLEMCFPYGSKAEADRDKGRVVRLDVRPVPTEIGTEKAAYK